MKKNTETIVDENGIELIVAYEYDRDYSFHAEIGNPATFVPSTILTNLLSVELVIAGTGIEQLPRLDERQIDFIKSKLQYK